MHFCCCAEDSKGSNLIDNLKAYTHLVKWQHLIHDTVQLHGMWKYKHVCLCLCWFWSWTAFESTYNRFWLKTVYWTNHNTLPHLFMVSLLPSHISFYTYNGFNDYLIECTHSAFMTMQKTSLENRAWTTFEVGFINLTTSTNGTIVDTVIVMKYLGNT